MNFKNKSLLNEYVCKWTNPEHVNKNFASPIYENNVLIAKLALNEFSIFMKSLKLNFTYNHAVGLFK